MSNFLQQGLSLLGIVSFLYFAFEGVFQGGGSNSVFIGVAVLSAMLVGAKALEKLIRD